MIDMNRVFLAGNLTQDPDTRYLPSGTAVSKLRLAANRRYKDTKTGELRDDPLFINVEAWNRTAEFCQEYLRKGRRVLVEGRLRMNSYKTQDGQNRNEILIVAERVQFADSKPAGAAGGAEGRQTEMEGAPSEGEESSYGGSSPNGPARSAPQAPSAWSGSPSANPPRSQSGAPAGSPPNRPGYGGYAPSARKGQPAPFPDESAAAGPSIDDYSSDAPSGGTDNDLPF